MKMIANVTKTFETNSNSFTTFSRTIFTIF